MGFRSIVKLDAHLQAYLSSGAALGTSRLYLNLINSPVFELTEIMTETLNYSNLTLRRKYIYNYELPHNLSLGGT